MHILLTGGTGLIGRQLCRHWSSQGHRLTVWSRTPEKVAKICGDQVRGIARLEDLGAAPVDAVVNLAGAPIADRPWTHKRKALLWSSRITLTETLLTWLEGREHKPQVLISGSAVGWYGDGGERELTEESPPVNEDFASQLSVLKKKQKQLNELTSKETGIRQQLAQLQQQSATFTKEMQTKQAEQQKLAAEKTASLISSISRNFAATLCDYGASLRELNNDEFVSLQLTTDHGRDSKDLYWVFKKSDIQQCVTGKVNATELLKKADYYQY